MKTIRLFIALFLMTGAFAAQAQTDKKTTDIKIKKQHANEEKTHTVNQPREPAVKQQPRVTDPEHTVNQPRKPAVKQEPRVKDPEHTVNQPRKPAVSAPAR